MAKIVDLQVGRIKIADHAVHGLVSSASSAVVPNGSGAPIMVLGTVTFTWTPSGSGGPTPSLGVILKVTRSRGSLVLINRQFTFGSGDGGVQSISDAALDADVTTSETYNFSVNYSETGGNVSNSAPLVKAVYTKR